MAEGRGVGMIQESRSVMNWKSTEEQGGFLSPPKPEILENRQL